ncbi:MAG TPA: hypothetical protein VGK02_10425 [Candidatus Aquicultor sp.]|jgi:tRNA A58 N-methylase Trm61
MAETLREKIETWALQATSKPGSGVALRQKAIDIANIGSNTRVLNIATGVGGMAFALREKTPHVTAIDVSEERIALAQQNPRADVIDKATVRQSTDPDGTTHVDVNVPTAAVEKALADSSVNEVVLRIKTAADEQIASLPADAFSKMAEKQAELVVQIDKVALHIPAEIVHVDELAKALDILRHEYCDRRVLVYR